MMTTDYVLEEDRKPIEDGDKTLIIKTKEEEVEEGKEDEEEVEEEKEEEEDKRRL